MLSNQPVRLLAISDENQGVQNGKTPAATARSTRRAFGDISNRKKAHASTTLGPAKAVSFASGADTTSVVKPAKNKGFQPPQRTPFRPLSTNIQQNDVSLQPTSSKTSTKKSELDLDSYGDIERPAGRLWVEEQALHRHEDDDDDSTISLGDMKAYRKELLDMFEEGRLEDFELMQLEDDAIIAQSEKRVLDLHAQVDGDMILPDEECDKLLTTEILSLSISDDDVDMDARSAFDLSF